MGSLTGLVACVAARHQLCPLFTPLEYIRIQFVFMEGAGWNTLYSMYLRAD